MVLINGCCEMADETENHPWEDLRIPTTPEKLARSLWGRAAKPARTGTDGGMTERDTDDVDCQEGQRTEH